jgi:hypothetical protein
MEKRLEACGQREAFYERKKELTKQYRAEDKPNPGKMAWAQAKKEFWEYQPEVEEDEENEGVPIGKPGDVDSTEIIQWVAWALGQPEVGPTDAPSAQHWSCFRWAKSCPDDFWTKLFPKTLPTGKEATEMAKARHADGRVLKHLDRIKAMAERAKAKSG